uniref:Efflux transporter, outer membrane factor (OMF) lipoprotein, NodT family n=1 Tax=Candidatus Kentrum sp. FW TaxID=2126338 RepID=A0A450TLA3_9GAMM|nr:MAG: efflux transporter, outer membrane factor (OMF) lipoprotein, NodT family [Candidatus Kentron sp. FW]
MRPPKYILLLPYLAILIGCQGLAPTEETRIPFLQMTIPDNWTAFAKASEQADQADQPDAKVAMDTGENPTGDPIPSWLDDFDDPRLQALVREAFGKNFDLEAALARVKAARAQAKRQGAEKLPELTANSSASRSKSAITNTTSSNLELGMNISWEIDLWNRLDNAAKAAVADEKAQQAEYRMAKLALAANVAKAWFDAIESDQQLRLAEKTVRSFENSLRTIEQRYRLGIGPALDVRLTRENVATAHSQREIRARNRDTSVRSLEILLGGYPAASLSIQPNLPELRQAVPVGLPSDLLNRRPDIIAAQARLLATDHRLAAARANRLPSVRLTASGGTASHELHNLLRADSLLWQLIGNLTQPLWDGGRLSAQVEIAAANRQQASAKYAAVALRAFREVESALTAEVLLAKQEAALRIATQEANAAAVLALDQYRQGLSDIITLLSTQRREFDAERSLLAVTKQRLNTRIDLYLALGGGF